MADYKLDIFQTLAAADTKKFDWLNEQPKETQKGFQPLVFMRWLSSVNNSKDMAEYQIEAVNEYLNKNFWELSEYPDLIFKLGCVVGIGKQLRHDWIPMAANKKASNKAMKFMGEINPRLSWNEVENLFNLYDLESFKELIVEYGIQKEEEKELIAAFKKKKS